jgi:hypothetical protein
MKVTVHQRSSKQKFNGQSQTFTLSCAKTYLGRLMKKAMNGEPVYIVRGPYRFTLQHVPEIDPIPLRPPGYFAHGDTHEEIALENLLSKASVVRAPKDLE